MSDVEFDFSNEIQQGRWELLKPHYDRGAIVVVSDPLDLVTVAHAMSKDQVNIVKIWLDNGELANMDEKHLGDFTENETVDFCDFIIVQPYVLIKIFK